jgi:uncharacterized protein YbaA (DUF1428 family)
MTYADFYALPLLKANLEAYRTMASEAGAIWIEYGALGYHEFVLEDGEDKGYCVPFPKAMQASDDETVVCAYVLYRSREHRDEVNAKVMEDARIKESCDKSGAVFDFTRMAFSGFTSLVSFGAK